MTMTDFDKHCRSSRTLLCARIETRVQARRGTAAPCPYGEDLSFRTYAYEIS